MSKYPQFHLVQAGSDRALTLLSDSSSNDWDASEDETLVEDEIFNQDIELREAENQFEALTAQHSSLGRPPQHGRSAAGLLLQTWPNSPSGEYVLLSSTSLYAFLKHHVVLDYIPLVTLTSPREHHVYPVQLRIDPHMQTAAKALNAASLECTFIPA